MERVMAKMSISRYHASGRVRSNTCTRCIALHYCVSAALFRIL
ncbi:unnamed protein product [Chondrus crispus]|uniref:Uncharacterized protein n=1 Tax=Chondrus crispus TaxID=2769 RepID=R7QDP9_CHOCR|nr:unnamed protein product [Chondrus crispus]CDF35540.1 unnamed protein product [Chondrus crispus]|eukprot:XP_005715359.1 unnamed protein product [Chondrus crispus]